MESVIRMETNMVTFLMQPVNYLKVAAIWLCDTVSKIYDPFEPNVALEPVSKLSELDSLFATELDTEFMLPSGEFLYQHPRPNDAGDTAIWHGICTGMKILRGDDVTAQLHFLKSLFVHNALIRGYHYGTNLPNDTTSNDSATGPLFAFYCALRFGDESTKADAGEMLLAWVKNLKEHDWALVDQAGVPTKFGKLESGVLTDPLRITLLMAILALAMAYDPTYNEDYLKLYRKYKPLLAYPKVKLLWLDTSYDTHRAAISLHILYWLTRDEVYKKGLQRIWRITSKENNAWALTLCLEALDGASNYPALVYRIADILGTFDYKKRQLGNMESLNPDWPSVKWGNKVRTKKPLPLNRRGSQDFFWQRNMMSKDEWVGVTHPDTFHSGLDFLVCYWLAKRLIPG
jgi:hypothetical protein